MATPADNQKQIDSLESQIQQIRNTKYRDNPFAAKNDPEILGLRAQQNTLKAQVTAAAPNNPATDAYQGVDRNSGQGLYVNSQTGERYLGPVKETPQTQVTTEANAENITTATARGTEGTVSSTTVPGVGQDNTLVQVNTVANQTSQPNTVTSQPQGTNTPVDPQTDPTAAERFANLGNEGVVTEPAALPRYTTNYDPETGQYDVYNLDTGQAVRTGLTEQQATLESEDLSAGAEVGENARAYNVEPVSDEGGYYGDPNGPTDDEQMQADNPDDSITELTADGAVVRSRAEVEAEAETLRQAQALQQIRAKSTNEDWRLRIRLAPNANYLYRAASPGILEPLTGTNGVVFPYTPQISTSYRANYDAYELVHTNYKGYFYKNSSVQEITVNGTFTANSAAEADYLLAVIHFFRSASKMFYGQDTDPIAGTPPPVLYMDGLGVYQFNEHPCLLSAFNYSLPSDVDYIRAGGARNYAGGAVNLSSIRNQQGAASNSPLSATLSRLTSLKNAFDNFINPGARANNPIAQNTTNYYGITGQPTYVPTKISISVTLLPLISRQEQAQSFSLKNYATGQGLRERGFF